MRGGTSKGPFFHAWDLPANVVERDELLINLMGSGHELEIDGIGGGSPQTSKVAIVSPSLHADADVDYLFVQVMVAQRRVDTAPNCGNMLCAVGPFAIEQGLVKGQEGKTLVRIRNLNTGTFVNSLVETPGGIVRYEGRTAIDGVPGTAAPVQLTFLDAVGSKTGKLFPTGQATDVIDGVPVTCIDMAMPMMVVEASQLGVTGSETPAELDANEDLPGSAAPEGRQGHGPGRCQRDGHPQAGVGFQAALRRHPAGSLLHAAQLPPRAGHYRFDRVGHCLCQPWHRDW